MSDFQIFTKVKNDPSNKPTSQKDSLAKFVQLFNVRLYCIYSHCSMRVYYTTRIQIFRISIVVDVHICIHVDNCVHTILLNVHLAYKVYKCTWNSFVALYYPLYNNFNRNTQKQNKQKKKRKSEWNKPKAKMYVCMYL